MRDWSLPRSAFAPVISFGYLGMMAGGAAAGVVGDRFGRRVALVGSLLIFGAMTIGIAFVHSVAGLGVLRFLTGIGLGGAIPNAAALVAEYVPMRVRPLAVTVTIVCIPLGGTVAGLIAIPALPALGWRTLFLICGVMPVVAGAALRWLLPESPRYLARHPHRRRELVESLRRMGHHVAPDAVFEDRVEGAARRASIGALFRPEFRRDTVALWAAFFSCLLAVYLCFSWIPSMLTGAGFSSSVASSGITMFNLGGVVGALAGGVCIGSWGSRRAMLVMGAIAVVGAGVMAETTLSPDAVVPLIVLLTITGAAINGVQTTMWALAAHIYPAAIRATGVGSAASFGRSGAVLSGYVGVFALEYRGAASFFSVIAVAMVVCCLALAAVRRHVAGRG
jgi:AAHS family 4-hydroxybenzoate transporter-like MFS transporter